MIGNIMAKARYLFYFVPFKLLNGLGVISGCRQLLCAEKRAQH